jgi:hypothetical protein
MTHKALLESTTAEKEKITSELQQQLNTLKARHHKFLLFGSQMYF